MKRIFHVVSHFEMGGAERVALNIARSQTDGFEYHVVEVMRGRSAFTQSFLQEMEEAGVCYHRSPIPVLVHFHYLFEKLAAVLFPLWFYFVFRKFRPDVIHCHTEIPNWAVYRLFHLFPKLTVRCCVVSTIHSTTLWHGMKARGRKIEAWLEEHGMHIAISQAVVGHYLRFMLNNGESTVPPIIYNGMQPVSEKKVYPRLVAGRQNILFAGRLEKEKGICHLVEIVKRLKDDRRYFFHILGNGSLSHMVETELSGQENVEICPPLYGIATYLGSFDYMIMPSEFEGLSIMSIESSIEHLPNIINAAPGLEDTLPEDWPLKVKNNDIESYMYLFQEVIPQGCRQQWANQAYSFAQQHFSLRKMQEAYEKIYQ